MEKEELLTSIKENGVSKTSELFNISTNTIRKILGDDINLAKREFNNKDRLEKALKTYGDLDWDEINTYYQTHSLSVTAKAYHMKYTTLKMLLEYKGYPIIQRSEEDLKELHRVNLANNLKEKYGVTNVSYLEDVKLKISKSLTSRDLQDKLDSLNKIKQTKLERYGDENYNNREKASKTTLDRFGVKNFGESEECKKLLKDVTDKRRKELWNSLPKDTIIEEYKIKSTHQLALEYHMHTDSFAKYLDYIGIPRHTYDEDMSIMSDTINKISIEKYGKKPWELGLESQATNGTFHGGVSDPEKKLMKLFEENSISYGTEYKIENRWYDFKIGDTLVELNPSSTHNINWNPFSSEGANKDKDYHKNKTLLAEKYNYRCIHIWDWDDSDKLLNLLNTSEVVYGRKCDIKLVPSDEEKYFLNKYHFQNYIKSKIAYGLYYNGELISIMTFGNPRYNKNYEWELLRYCSSKKIIGGAEKLFKYFINNNNPSSVISYCDRSKFKGDVYSLLGFNLKSISSPRRHWYNIKSKQHITENLLLQRGYDQLFKTNFGKEYSNEELMLASGFVEIYDCGQATYIWEGELNEQ